MLEMVDRRGTSTEPLPDDPSAISRCAQDVTFRVPNVGVSAAAAHGLTGSRRLQTLVRRPFYFGSVIDLLNA